MRDDSTKRWTAAEVVAKAATGDVSGADLGNIKLAKEDLTGAKLAKIAAAGADLRRAVLRDADLSGADLSGADLRKADLRGANLSDANLRRANLAEADFTGANLVRTNGVEATAEAAIFDEADLTDADWSAAFLRRSRFSQTRMWRVRLTGADGSEARLSDVDLSDADWSGGVAAESRWAGVKAPNLRAASADLSFCEMRGIDLSKASLAQAKLFGATLMNVDFSGANLAGAVFNGSHHDAVSLQGANLQKTYFRWVRGYSQAEFQAIKEQGAVTDLFLIRRFFRVVRRHVALQAALAALATALAIFSYRYAVNPYHWSLHRLEERADKLYANGHMEQSIAVSDVIVNKFRDDPRIVANARMQIARAVAARGDAVKAAEMFREIAATYEGAPVETRAMQELARLESQRGAPDKAREIYEKLIERAAGSEGSRAEAELALVTLLRQQRRLAEALAMCNDIVSRHSADRDISARALATRVEIACEMNRLDDADDALKRLAPLADDPGRKLLRGRSELLAADLCYRLGRSAEGEARYRRLVESGDDPGAAREAGVRLLEMYQTAHRTAEADQLIAGLIGRTADPIARDQLILRQADVLWNAGRREQAIELLRTKVPSYRDRGTKLDGCRMLMGFYAAQQDFANVEKMYAMAVGAAGNDDAKAGVKFVLSDIYAGRGLFDKAEKLLQSVVDHGSENVAADARFRLADLDNRTGKVEKAERIWRELYSEKGNDATEWRGGTMLFDFLMNHRRFPEASALLDKMDVRWQGKPEAATDLKFRRAALLSDTGSTAKAVALLRELASQTKDRRQAYDAHVRALEILQTVGDAPGGEAEYRDMIQLAENDPPEIFLANNQMARFYESVGMKEKAEAIYEKMLTGAPDVNSEDMARFELVELCIRGGSLDKAMAGFRQILAKRSPSSQAHRVGADLVEAYASRGDFAQAQRVLELTRETVVGLTRDSDEFAIQEARLTARAKNAEAGLVLLRRNLPQMHDADQVVQAFLFAADLCGSLGDVKTAEELFAVAAKKLAAEPDRRWADAMIGMAQVYARCGQIAKAETTLSEVIAKQSGTPAATTAARELANLAARKGDLAKSTTALRQLAAADADPVQAFADSWALAEMLANDGRFADASKLLDEMAARWGELPDLGTEIMFRRIELLRRQQRSTEAVALLRKQLPSLCAAHREASAFSLWLGLSLDIGDLAGAEEALAQATKTLTADPHTIDLMKLQLADFLVSHNGFDRAAKTYTSMFTDAKDAEIAGEARVRLANALWGRGQRADAERLLREALSAAANPDRVLELQRTLGRLLSDDGRVDEADALLAAVQQKIEPGSDRRLGIALERAEVLQRAKKFAAATALLNAELATRGANPGLRADAHRRLLAIAVESNAETATIEQLHRAAVAEFGRDPGRLAPIEMAFANFYAGHNEDEKALELYGKIARRDVHDPSRWDARVAIARVYRKEGNLTKAEREYQAVLDEGGGSSSAFDATIEWWDLLVKNERFPELDKLWTVAAARWPSGSGQRLAIMNLRARLLDQQRRPDAAAALVTDELAHVSDPNQMFDAYSFLLELWQRNNRPENAAEVYRTMQKKFAQDPARLARAAEMYHP